MSDKFDEFLDEVQQDIKQEKYMQLWQRYGRHATAGAAALLVAAASYMLWDRYEHGQRVKASESLFSVQDYLIKNKLDEARAVLDSIGMSDSKTYGYLRDFQKAGILREKGDADSITEALKMYDYIASLSGVPLYIRHYATFLGAKMALDFNVKSKEDILKILEPLTDKNSAWRFFAIELKGLIYYTQGDYARALEQFAALGKEKDLPESMRMRVRMMTQLSNQNRIVIEDDSSDDEFN